MIKRILVRNIIFSASFLVLLCVVFIVTILLVISDDDLSIQGRKMVGTIPIQICLIFSSIRKMLVNLLDLFKKNKTIYVTVKTQSFVDYSIIEKDYTVKHLYCYDIDGKNYKCYLYDEIHKGKFFKNQIYTIEMLKHTHIIVFSHSGKALDGEDDVCKKRSARKKKIISFGSKLRRKILNKFNFVFEHKIPIFTLLSAVVLLCPIIVGFMGWPTIIAETICAIIVIFICMFYMIMICIVD